MDAIKPCLLLYQKKKTKPRDTQQPLKFKVHEHWKEPEIGNSRGKKKKINYLKSIYTFFHRSLYYNGAIAQFQLSLVNLYLKDDQQILKIKTHQNFMLFYWNICITCSLSLLGTKKISTTWGHAKLLYLSLTLILLWHEDCSL